MRLQHDTIVAEEPATQGVSVFRGFQRHVTRVGHTCTQKKVRLGTGYNFSSFSDDEFARLDEDHGGPFFRVVANY